jgi:hypothetical protein
VQSITGKRFVLLGNTSTYGQGLSNILLIKTADPLGPIIFNDIQASGGPFNRSNPYPMPFRDRFTIPMHLGSNISEIRLFNSYGIEMTEYLEGKISISGHQMRFENLQIPKGVYLMQMKVNHSFKWFKIVSDN